MFAHTSYTYWWSIRGGTQSWHGTAVTMPISSVLWTCEAGWTVYCGALIRLVSCRTDHKRTSDPPSSEVQIWGSHFKGMVALECDISSAFATKMYKIQAITYNLKRKHIFYWLNRKMWCFWRGIFFGSSKKVDFQIFKNSFENFESGISKIFEIVLFLLSVLLRKSNEKYVNLWYVVKINKNTSKKLEIYIFKIFKIIFENLKIKIFWWTKKFSSSKTSHLSV